MLQIEVRIKGSIGAQWSGWFDGLTISHPAPGETVLRGALKDQAALYGVISRLCDLGLELTSVSSRNVKEVRHEKPIQ